MPMIGMGGSQREVMLRQSDSKGWEGRHGTEKRKKEKRSAIQESTSGWATEGWTRRIMRRHT